MFCAQITPDFAYFLIRFSILFSLRMPKTKIIPYEWYDTPNIHLFTIKDCKVIRKILDWLSIDEFRRDSLQKRLPAADLFDDFLQNDYAKTDYMDF